MNFRPFLSNSLPTLFPPRKCWRSLTVPTPSLVLRSIGKSWEDNCHASLLFPYFHFLFAHLLVFFIVWMFNLNLIMSEAYRSNHCLSVTPFCQFQIKSESLPSTSFFLPARGKKNSGVTYSSNVPLFTSQAYSYAFKVLKHCLIFCLKFKQKTRSMKPEKRNWHLKTFIFFHI